MSGMLWLGLTLTLCVFQISLASDKRQTDLQSEINNLKYELGLLKIQIGSLQATAGHLEQGNVFCVNSDGWTDTNSGSKEEIHNIVFQTPYATPPMINYGIADLDIDHTHDIRFYIDIRNVTTTGFTAVCGSWADTKINSVSARWTSNVA